MQIHSASAIHKTLLVAFAAVFLASAAVPVQAQSPARRLADVAEEGSTPDSIIGKYRSHLDVAARYNQNRSTVVDTLVSGVRELRKRGLSAPVLELMSVDGLGGLVRRGRPFEEVLGTYLEYRIERGLYHESAIKKMKTN